MFTACLVERLRFIILCKNKLFCKPARKEAGIEIIQIKTEVRDISSSICKICPECKEAFNDSFGLIIIV